MSLVEVWNGIIDTRDGERRGEGLKEIGRRTGKGAGRGGLRVEGRLDTVDAICMYVWK